MRAAALELRGRTHVVGIADLAVSGAAGDFLITHALGSCLGVTAYDPVARVGGLVHVMLPIAAATGDEASQRPAKYVETGVALLFRELYARGARKERIELRVAGGARTTGAAVDECFEIGRRNTTALKKVLWQNGILIRAQDLGGTHSRTLSLALDHGRVAVSTGGSTRWLGGEEPCP